MFPRWFEVITINQQVAILSEPEINLYKSKILEVRTELTRDEVKEINKEWEC